MVEAVFSKIFPLQTYIYGKYLSVIFFKYLGGISRSVYSYSFVPEAFQYADVRATGAIANRDSLYSVYSDFHNYNRLQSLTGTIFAGSMIVNMLGYQTNARTPMVQGIVML